MHLNATYKNSWNRKQNNVCVTGTLDSELYRCKPVLTYAISGNVIGGGTENAGVENAGVTKYGKPSEENTLKYQTKYGCRGFRASSTRLTNLHD